MTRRRAAQAEILVAAAVAAGAALAAAGSLVHGAPPTPRPAPGHPIVVTAPPRPRSPATGLTRASAVRVARRFAVAYARWDAGPHDARSGRALAAAALAPVLTEMGARAPRPSARPARPLALRVIAAARSGRRYLVAVGTGRLRVRHVATLVVVATAQGPRVAAVSR